MNKKGTTRIWRRLIITLVLCLATALFYSIFLRWYGVSWALSAQMQRGPGTTVDFTEIAPFAWDRVYIFGPYSSPEHIQECLGFDWPGVERTSIDWSDSVNLVVFVRDRHVVYWFEHRRLEELGELANAQGYARGEARFTVIVGEENRPTLVLVKR
jgi:hypothetical protein